MKAIAALLIGVAAVLWLELSFGVATGFQEIPPALILFGILLVGWFVVGRFTRPR